VENRGVSKANVDLVRSSFEAFGRGDFDQAFACYDATVEWQTAEDEPDTHTYVGIPALRRFVAYLAEPWSDRFGPAIEFDDFIDCGDWVVTPWSARLHGHGSGIEIDVSETYAVLVRDGLVKRVDEYRTVEQALAAVGPALRETAPPGERGRFQREE
jgi:ketosteroid isomerase-like protein